MSEAGTTRATEMTIGEFAARCRLSPKALRLYDGLGLLVPARVDAATGYRWYAPGQLGRARLVALLRHAQMPLATIARVLDSPGGVAADLVRAFGSERETALRTALSGLAQASRLLEGQTLMTSYDIDQRAVPDRAVLSAVRYVHAAEAGAVLGALLGRMAATGPSGLPFPLGCPYTIYHGVVTEDSDGPVELVRPMAGPIDAARAAATLGDVQARTDPAHDELFVRLTTAESAWPAVLPVLDALDARAGELGRRPSGPSRQVMIADWRTARPEDVACELVLAMNT